MKGRISKAIRATPPSLWFAILIAIGFGVLHLSGARDLVSVVSGTPAADVPFAIAAPIGLLYVMSWLALVVLAPILGLVALIQIATRRLVED
jgi:hypothetical protein